MADSKMPPEGRVTEHMTEMEIAAYLDRRLGQAERDEAERHMAACAVCRKEVLAAQQLVGRSRLLPRLIGAAAILAATLTIMLVTRAPPAEPVRDDGRQASIVAVGPSGDVPAAGLRFVWQRVPGAEVYRVTVTAAAGATHWTASTADTALALPDSVVLPRQQRLFWVTDVLLRDGTSGSTGLRAFQLRP